jgi:multicomponent Na+:H+ antiporter subunit C
MSRGGRANPTFIGDSSESSMLDPLPQAFVLTAIVIGFGTTSLLLAIAYRSWVITHDDEVEDDVEDRMVLQRQVDKEVDAFAAAADSDDETLADAEELIT